MDPSTPEPPPPQPRRPRPGTATGNHAWQQAANCHQLDPSDSARPAKICNGGTKPSGEQPPRPLFPPESSPPESRRPRPGTSTANYARQHATSRRANPSVPSLETTTFNRESPAILILSELPSPESCRPGPVMSTARSALQGDTNCRTNSHAPLPLQTTIYNCERPLPSPGPENNSPGAGPQLEPPQAPEQMWFLRPREEQIKLVNELDEVLIVGYPYT